MLIDNSSATIYKFCPWKYYEECIKHIELNPTKTDGGYSPLEYGDRMHQLLETYYGGADTVHGIANNNYLPSINEALECEAQIMIEAYKAHYPVEDFDIIDVERPFKVALPNFCPKCYSFDNLGHTTREWTYCLVCNTHFKLYRHVLTGKIDIVYRSNEDGYLYIMDHKSEKRGAKSNLPQKWAEKDQASLYLWAAERIYGEKPKNFIVNVLTRQSEKGQVGPSFPDRQKLERSQANIDHAVRDIVYWADRITEDTIRFGTNPWPANRDKCAGEGWSTFPCEYQLLHGYGEDTSEIERVKYRPKKEYLNLGGVPIIQ